MRGPSITEEAQSQAHVYAPSFCLLCRADLLCAHARAHRHAQVRSVCTRGQTHSAETTDAPKECVQAHRSWVGTHTHTPCSPRPARLPPRPPPAGRLPCQVQLSRPKQISADKGSAFEPEPFPPLRSDKRAGKKEKTPLFLLLRLLLCCSSTQRGCLGACSAPLPPPPLHHARITGTVTGGSSGLGFNRRELQPQAAKPGLLHLGLMGH